MARYRVKRAAQEGGDLDPISPETKLVQTASSATMPIAPSILAPTITKNDDAGRVADRR